jgi:hypothetical protein
MNAKELDRRNRGYTQMNADGREISASHIGVHLRASAVPNLTLGVVGGSVNLALQRSLGKGLLNIRCQALNPSNCGTSRGANQIGSA